jgi:NADH-quinone oxidoreductase subunit J
MTIPFLIVAVLTVAGFAAAMAMRNLVHSVLSLTVGFVGLAMAYLVLGAQFVGFTQIIVYVGAVAILAVFAIMMTRSGGVNAMPALSSSAGVGGGVAGILFAVLGWAVWSGSRSLQPAGQASVSVVQIGEALMHRFVLPLEIMGLLLTAALIGAVIVAMPQERGER